MKLKTKTRKVEKRNIINFFKNIKIYQISNNLFKIYK